MCYLTNYQIRAYLNIIVSDQGFVEIPPEAIQRNSALNSGFVPPIIELDSAAVFHHIHKEVC